jgi:hypothetical protein
MKKISLIVVLAFILVLGFTMTVCAAGTDEGISTRIYFDNWVGANMHVKTGSGSYNADTQCSFFGFELNAAQIKFGAEFGINASDKDEADDSQDYNMSNFKIGFRVADGEEAKLDVIVSSLKFDGDAFGDHAATGTMLGADLTYALSEQLFFQASYAHSLDASWGDDDSANMSALNLKAGCLVTDNVAISAGYRLYTIKGNGLTMEPNGMTLGVMCRF